MLLLFHRAHFSRFSPQQPEVATLDALVQLVADVHAIQVIDPIHDGALHFSTIRQRLFHDIAGHQPAV